MSGGWTFSAHELRDRAPERVAEEYEAWAPLALEAAPDDPRPPIASLLAVLEHLPEHQRGGGVVARDGAGRLAGYAEWGWSELPDNRDQLSGGVAVLPEFRRRGLGTLLLRRLVEAADAAGRAVLNASTHERVPAGEAFARRFGAELGQVMRASRLDLQALDRELLERWLREGPLRAPGYSLVTVTGRTPDELLDEVVSVLGVMNTAPRDGLRREDFAVTADMFREEEKAGMAAGFERWAVYAREDATGRLVGLTDVHVQPGVRDRIAVGNTGVDPAHRGRALGKWLKAEMARTVLDRAPEVRWLVTSNSTTNAPMLAINTELGFRPEPGVQRWQVTTSTLRALL